MYNLSLDFIVKEYPCYLSKNNRVVFEGYRHNGLKLKVIEEMTVRKDLHNLYVITDEDNIQRAIAAIRKSYFKMIKRLIKRLDSTLNEINTPEYGSVLMTPDMFKTVF